VVRIQQAQKNSGDIAQWDFDLMQSNSGSAAGIEEKFLIARFNYRTNAKSVDI